MPLLPNTGCLSLSHGSPEPVLDPHYYSAHLSKSPPSQTRQYARDANSINRLLRRIKKSPSDISLYLRLRAVLARAESNTEFECFFNACDCDRDSILADFLALRHVTSLYLAHRTIPKRTHPNQSRTLIDRTVSVSRSRSALTKKKLQKLISPYPSLIVHDHGTNLTLENMRGETCLIELLHLKNSGGAQTDKINNKIEGLSAPSPASFFAVFADGNYANTVISSARILAALRANPHSFWFNTAGFQKFIKDFS